VSNLDILAAVDALQVKYIRALDRHDMQGWLNCFAAEEAAYLCMSAENEQQGLPIATMMDDSRERLIDRVKFVTQVWEGTFDDYMTRHFVQRLDCAPNDDGSYSVESNFLVTYTTANRRSGILASGTYLDCVRLEAGQAVFRSKKALLDTITTPRYLVYPI